MNSQISGATKDLSATRRLIDTRTLEIESLQKEKTRMEGVQTELKKTRQDLTTKEDETHRVSQEKRVLEVKLESYQEHSSMGDNQQLMRIADLDVRVDQITKTTECQGKELGAQQGTGAELQSLNASLREQMRSAETTRIELRNSIQELKGNLRVCCRVRPTEGSVALDSSDPSKLCLCHGSEHHAFPFDKIFGPTADQATVFDEVSGLVQSALDGHKVCVLAFGQVGSGKSFTMQGTDEPGCSGLIFRSLLTIFRECEEMRSRGWQFSVWVSMMEIQNETFRDLQDAGTTGHVIVPHEEWGTIVAGMSSRKVESMEQISSLMAATDFSGVSSRSAHSVFTLHLQGTNSMLNKEVRGTLNLVDLAASERDTSCGEGSKELCYTNRSLSSLADVLAGRAQGKPVPYMSSKLTHLMEPCLSGHGKTLVIVNVLSEPDHAEETLSSLRFAKQAAGQCLAKPRRSAKSLQTSLPKSPSAVPKVSRKRSRLVSGLCRASNVRRAILTFEDVAL